MNGLNAAPEEGDDDGSSEDEFGSEDEAAYGMPPGAVPLDDYGLPIGDSSSADDY